MVDHRADNLIVITRGKTTNNFYIFGGRDESSQDLIQGITLAGVFFDEVALMPESFVNQATGRCSVDGSKFWFNCNPSGPYHWFKVNWIDRAVGYIGKERAAELRAKDEPVKNILYVHFVMDDNLSLSDEIKERYRNTYRGVFYKANMNKQMKQLLEESEPETIIAIHNHPGSSVPSLADLMTCVNRGYYFGLVACHDGKVYKYWVDKNKFNSVNAGFALDRMETQGYDKEVRTWLEQAGVYMEVW